MDEYIKQHDRNVNLALRSGREELFPVAKYNGNLIDQFNEKNIDFKLNSELIPVDGKKEASGF